MQMRKHILNTGRSLIGYVITKDADDDKRQKDAGLETLTKELSTANSNLDTARSEYKDAAKSLDEIKKSVEGMADVPAETTAKLKEFGTEIAEKFSEFTNMSNAIEAIKKEMAQPIYTGDDKLKDFDIAQGIELQKRAFVDNGGDVHEFKADMDNLVNPSDVRSAMRKMTKMTAQNKTEVIRSFTELERKAFDGASLDSMFFMPEMLGMEVDCEIECAQIWDLYQQQNVSTSSFMYPHIRSYGDMGTYDCDAKCDAEFGPEGNITWQQGRTYDFRGAFCFQKDVLREANYDLLGFMLRSVARSYRINRNNALIRGDGVNEPRGWMTAKAFPTIAAPFFNPNHQDLRQFLASAPVEYGKPTSVMHQNIFAYYASMVDGNGRFIFGDGLMGYGPENVVDDIRISNCLPDATEDGTKGSTAAPFDAGAFIMATGVWDAAYASVSHRPMFMEQFLGGSTAWCSQWQFGAKDGGFVACSNAARILQAGSSAAP